MNKNKHLSLDDILIIERELTPTYLKIKWTILLT